MYRAVDGADGVADEIQSRIDHLVKAISDTTASTEAQAQAVRDLNARMQELQVVLSGDSTISRRNEAVPLSLSGRVGFLVFGHWDSQQEVGGNYADSLAIAEQQFSEWLPQLKALAEDLSALEAEMQGIGAPWTPGRMPDWP